MKFLARRLSYAIVLLFLVSVLSFLLLQFAPGNFFDELAMNPQISQATIAHLRTTYGIDQPMLARYFLWLKSAIRGDFGYSLAYNMPVGPLLFRRTANTLLLAGFATALCWILALALGIWSATRPGKWDEHLVGGTMGAFLAVPDVVIAIGLLLFAVRTRILPVGGMTSEATVVGQWQELRDLAQHMILPVMALVIGMLPSLVRHVRSAMSEALASTYVNAARAHGIARSRLLWRHALPLAANPLISLFGVSIATLLSASLLIEVVMSWPGLGPFFLEAILARDVHVVIAAVLLSSLFVLGGQFLADTLLYVCDPRIRRP